MLRFLYGRCTLAKVYKMLVHLAVNQKLMSGQGHSKIVSPMHP